MSRNIRLYLEDVVDCSVKVLRYTQGITFEQFIGDEKMFDAVARNLQIIGEAVKNEKLIENDSARQRCHSRLRR